MAKVQKTKDMHRGKQILLKAEYKVEIAKLFNVTPTTVRNALSFRTYGGYADDIRRMAIEKYGGREVPKYYI